MAGCGRLARVDRVGKPLIYRRLGRCPLPGRQGSGRFCLGLRMLALAQWVGPGAGPASEGLQRRKPRSARGVPTS